jgi:hypothetical protein
MVDVVIAPDSVDVVGGVSTVKINTTVGATGTRGSHIFVGSGNPNKPETLIPGGTPEVFDMFINLSPDDIEYLFMYQYLNQDGDFTWVRLLRLVPNTYLENNSATFTDGSAIVYVPIAQVIPLASVGVYQATNFNIQYSIAGTDAIASSVEINGIEFPGNVAKLKLTFKAVKYSGSSWSNLSGSYPIHLLVTIV